LGRRDSRALASQLKRLIAHLLKWQFQPQQRGASWRKTIVDARFVVGEASGVLRARLEDEGYVSKMYPSACRQARRDMDDETIKLPDECPYSLSQLLDEDFWPEATQ
jgi:hypothetical protein